MYNATYKSVWAAAHIHILTVAHGKIVSNAAQGKLLKLSYLVEISCRDSVPQTFSEYNCIDVKD